MTKFSIKNYWKPTPKRLRMIGDGLGAASLIVALGGLFSYKDLIDSGIFTPKDIRVIIIISIIVGGAGKFLTNCFKGTNEKPE